MPVTTGDPADYEKIVNRGRDYPVANTVTASQKPHYHTPRPSGNKTITMRVIDTLLHGFGDEGGRNVAVTRFVGLLLSKWVDADVATAYELTTIANSVTDPPFTRARTGTDFESIVKSEIRREVSMEINIDELQDNNETKVIEPPKSMKELTDRIYQAGELWRKGTRRDRW